MVVCPPGPAGFARRTWGRRYSGRTSVTDPHPQAPPANDAVLLPFLAASDAAEADQRLCVLIEREVRPLVARILRQKAAGTAVAAPADVEDIAAECAAAVLERLTDLRAGRDVEPIASLSAYVAVVGLQRLAPLPAGALSRPGPLEEPPALPVRAPPGAGPLDRCLGHTLCGLAAWRGARAASRPRRGGPRPAMTRATPSPGPGREPRRADRISETEAAPALLRWAGGPLLLDDLVELVGRLLGLVDEPAPRAATPTKTRHRFLSRSPIPRRRRSRLSATARSLGRFGARSSSCRYGNGSRCC